MVGKATGCIDIDGVLYRRGYSYALLLWPAQLKLTASITVESNPFLNSRWNVTMQMQRWYRNMEQRVLISEEENTMKKMMMKNTMTVHKIRCKYGRLGFNQLHFTFT
jgi:hypothetical protein